MTTKFNIEPALLDRADQVSGERTKETVLTTAHEEFIAIRQQRALLNTSVSLSGTPRSTTKPDAHENDFPVIIPYH